MNDLMIKGRQVKAFISIRPFTGTFELSKSYSLKLKLVARSKT